MSFEKIFRESKVILTEGAIVELDKTVEVVPPISVHVVPGVSVEVVPLYSGQ